MVRAGNAQLGNR